MWFAGAEVLSSSALFPLRWAARRRILMDASPQFTMEDRDRQAAHCIDLMSKGERQGLAQLYDLLSGTVYSLAYRVLGDAAEAQDVLQEIFLQVWNTAASYEQHRGSVFSWVVTLARNRAIDRLRMRRRRAALLEGAALELQPAPLAETDGATTLGLRERSREVRVALDRLPADQRLAIELAYFSSLTQQEIADRLNEPLGTIKARIRRGLLRLKEELPAHP